MRTDHSSRIIAESDYAGSVTRSLASGLAGLLDRGRHWKGPTELLAAMSPVSGGLRIYSGNRCETTYGALASAAEDTFGSLAEADIKALPAAARYAAGRLTLPLDARVDLDVEVFGSITVTGVPVTMTRLFRNARALGGADTRIPVSTCIELPLGNFSDYSALVTIGGQMEAEAFRHAYVEVEAERRNPITASQAGPPLDRALFENTLAKANCAFMFNSVDALARLGAPVIARTHSIVTDALDDDVNDRVRQALSALRPRSIGGTGTATNSVVELATDAGMVRWQRRSDYFAIRAVEAQGTDQPVWVASAHDALDGLLQCGAEGFQDSVFSACLKTANRLEGRRVIDSHGGSQLGMHDL